mmetsp:Transcript_9188/g.16939  ORF Transcript_9188/g.16939 Transcript_9188/m.16939 type:complete len:89 (+) Transcript_9188:316-582(+)
MKYKGELRNIPTNKCVSERTSGTLGSNDRVKYDDSACVLVKCYHCCSFRKGGDNDEDAVSPYKNGTKYFRIDPYPKEFTGLTAVWPQI